MFEFQRLLDWISKNDTTLNDIRTVLCELIVQLPTLDIHGLLCRAVFSKKCCSVDNMEAIPPLLYFLMKCLDRRL